MTKNQKVAAGLVGGLALVLAVGAYEFSSNNSRNELATTPSDSVLPADTTANSSVLPSSATPVQPPRQWQSTAPATPIGSAPAVVPSQPAATSTTTTVVRTPSGALAPNPTLQPPLQPEQANLAPLPGQTTVSSTETVAPGAVPPATVTTTRTTAYAPESTTVTHRVYVHRTVRHHHSSGKVHVARAVKHTVMFTAKLPGRLRI